MDVRTDKRIYANKGLGRGHVNNKVCLYWLQGKCSRNPCRFSHSAGPLPRQSFTEPGDLRSKTTWTNPNYHSSKNGKSNGRISSVDIITQQIKEKYTRAKEAKATGNSIATQKKLCDYWVKGTCVQGDNCRNIHSWFYGSEFSYLTKLEGHDKAVTGIALPSGSNKLYSVSGDQLRVWDCHTGQCAATVNLEGETGTMVSEATWIFVGLTNAVKAWNTCTQTELTLKGPVGIGIVHSIIMVNDMLFAGTDDGDILGWRFNAETNVPELCALLKGHRNAVLSLVVGTNRLYSSSSDKTIRVWDLGTLQCIQTLNGHRDAVMSVLCWDSFLLSGSLDGTIQVWAATERGDLEAIYEHKEGHGILALCGICDAEAKPILLCSCNDKMVRLYDLPSFVERGRIFATQEVRVVEIGTHGLFFTGDASGQLSVWKLHGEA